MRQSKAWDRFLSSPPDLEGGVRLQPQREDRSGRALLRFLHEGQSVALQAGWLSVPYPSGLRRLIASDPDLQMVVVERIPRGLDQACRDVGVSCLDIHGRGRVVGPGFVYLVSPGSSEIASAAKDAEESVRSSSEVPPDSRRASPFAPKASRIARALLSDPSKEWRLSELADDVGVDPGNAHRVLAALVEMGLIERDHNHYLVGDPGSLLEAWADHARRPRERIRIGVRDNLELVVRNVVGLAEGEAVVSGEFAAEKLAPHLPSRRAVVHCVSVEGWGVIESSSSAEVAAAPGAAYLECDFADAGVAQFSQQVDGLPLAHPAQIYVDLAQERGRARGAAEHLRSEVLGY